MPYLIQALVFGASFFVYILTCSRSVPPGDGGLFIGAACLGGVAQPPGYPLFTILARLACLIPLGEPAFRVNLLCGFFGALSAAILYAAVYRATQKLAPAILAAGLFAFSSLQWRYSVITEVFTLNQVFVTALLYWSLRFWQEPKTKWIYWGALTAGLGLANHHSLVLIALPLAVGILWSARSLGLLTSPAPFAGRLLGCLAVGFIFYLYLPLAAWSPAAMGWGDASHWSGFVKHFLRQEYGTFRLHAHSTEHQPLFTNLLIYFRHLALDLSWPGLAIAVVAWLNACNGRAAKKSAPKKAQKKKSQMPSPEQKAKISQPRPLLNFARVSLLSLVFYLVVFHWLSRFDLNKSLNFTVFERFYLMANTFFFFWLGYGFWQLTELSAQKSKAWLETLSPWVLGLGTQTIGPAIMAVALGASGMQLAWNWREEDMSKSFVFSDFARALLAPLPAQSILFTRGDLIANVVGYTVWVERLPSKAISADLELLRAGWYRRVADKYLPDLQRPPGVLGFGPQDMFTTNEGLPSYSLRQLVDANFDKSKIFFTVNDDGPAYETLKDKYIMAPLGAVKRVLLKSAPLDIDQLIEERKPYAEAVERIRYSRKNPSRWERVVFNEAHLIDGQFGNFALAQAVERGRDLKLLYVAIDFLERFVSAHPDQAFGYKNLGLAYYQLLQKKIEPADPIREKVRAAWTRYLEFGLSDLETNNIRTALAQIARARQN